MLLFISVVMVIVMALGVDAPLVSSLFLTVNELYLISCFLFFQTSKALSQHK